MTFRGFALSGFLVSLLGALLPAWNYHVTEQHAAAGWLFFALASGLLGSGLARFPARTLRLTGCLLAALALLTLSILPPPLPFPSQFMAWFVIGLAAGLIDARSAAPLTRAGIYFGAGCLASALSVAAALRWGYAAQVPGIFALVPIFFAFLFLKSGPPLPPDPEPLRQFSTPGALIFAALLLFQSGSEWTLAGWLPLFLTHRLGISPETALWMLAFYWLALLLGRIANLFLLAHVRHGRILFSSAAAAFSGCILLSSTDNTFGAAFAILLIGGGFAGVYPLLAEKIGTRFHQSHIFSLSLAGGLLFPWLAGLLAESVSLTAIIAIPGISIFLVVALLLVLWLESKVTGR